MPVVTENTRLLANARTVDDVRRELARLNLILDALGSANGARLAALTLPVDDNTSVIFDHNNPTAQVRLDAGAISRGKTRVLATPDQDVDLTPDTGTFSAAAHKNRHDPEDGVDPLDAAAPSGLAGVQAAGEGSSHGFARADHAHQIQHGIADNHLVTVDHAAAADNDYAKFTADGVEGRSYAEVRSDISATLTTITGNTTLNATHDIVLVDASSGAVTVTLPAASTRSTPYVVKKIDSSGNSVTIDGDGSETIDDATTIVLTVQYESVGLDPDATQWWIF